MLTPVALAMTARCSCCEQSGEQCMCSPFAFCRKCTLCTDHCTCPKQRDTTVRAQRKEVDLTQPAKSTHKWTGNKHGRSYAGDK